MPLPGIDSPVAADLVRALLAGGFKSPDKAVFLCLVPAGIGVVESSASSPDASLEEGCSRSAVDDLARSSGAPGLRFRLAEPEDEGEDIDALEFRDERWTRYMDSILFDSERVQSEDFLIKLSLW